jgi:peptide/nickel transport system substrate-binding protein
VSAKKLAGPARSGRAIVKPRFLGVLVTAILLVGAYMWWRSAAPPAGPAQDARPARGGQIVASIRTEPRTYNRLAARDQTTEAISMLTQGRLIRVNRATFELEPWLAERWESSADGRTHTLHLRPGLTWSDGVPLTSADVLFSLDAIFDPKSASVLADALRIGGEPIRATAPDPATVVVTYPAPSGAGIRLLDTLTIVPKHKLEAALKAGTFASAWNTTTPPAELVGAGPFVLSEYQPGQRLIFERNPRYWRKAADGTALPYLDRLVLEVVPEQNAELLRLQSGASDLTTSEIRPEDYVPVRRAEEQGQLRLLELGVSTDADALWFCLKPEIKRKDPRFAFVQQAAFRQAISHAVDREAFAETVFLGAAVPIWGPVTPGNQPWFWPDIPRYAPNPARARELLKGIGLEDRNGNGIVEDAAGTEAKFTVITQQGVSSYERGTTVLREKAKEIGIELDIAPLEQGAMIQRMLACNYDAIYMRPLFTDLDPAGNLDFWLSSGDAHFWNLAQRMPATEWERRIDTIMLEQAATIDPARRRTLFNDAQRILAENLPVLYFAAPRMYGAHSARLNGVVPSVMRPNVLWSADTLNVRED